MRDEIPTGDPGLPEPRQPRDNQPPDDAATNDGSIQDDGAASLSDTAVTSDEAQDLHRDPAVPDTPLFGDGANLPRRIGQMNERRRELRGNRGPDEVQGFGQGA